MGTLVTLACLAFALLVAAVVLLYIDARAERTRTAIKLAAHDAAISALQGHARSTWIAPEPDPSRVGPPSAPRPALTPSHAPPRDAGDRRALETPIPSPFSGALGAGFRPPSSPPPRSPSKPPQGDGSCS